MHNSEKWNCQTCGEEYAVGVACDLCAGELTDTGEGQNEGANRNSCMAGGGNPGLGTIAEGTEQVSIECPTCGSTTDLHFKKICGQPVEVSTAASADVLEGLRYIADSPAQEHGGFHPEAVRTAKAAIERVGELEKQLAQMLEEAELLQQEISDHKLMCGQPERRENIALRERAEKAEQEREEFKAAAYRFQETIRLLRMESGEIGQDRSLDLGKDGL